MVLNYYIVIYFFFYRTSFITLADCFCQILIFFVSSIQDGSEQWFILDEEDSSEVVGSEVRFENEEVDKTSTTNPDENMKQNGDNIAHVSEIFLRECDLFHLPVVSKGTKELLWGLFHGVPGKKPHVL